MARSPWRSLAARTSESRRASAAGDAVPVLSCALDAPTVIFAKLFVYSVTAVLMLHKCRPAFGMGPKPPSDTLVTCFAMVLEGSLLRFIWVVSEC